VARIGPQVTTLEPPHEPGSGVAVGSAADVASERRNGVVRRDDSAVPNQRLKRDAR
jgi:hypothetical protein